MKPGFLELAPPLHCHKASAQVSAAQLARAREASTAHMLQSAMAEVLATATKAKASERLALTEVSRLTMAGEQARAAAEADLRAEKALRERAEASAERARAAAEVGSTG